MQRIKTPKNSTVYGVNIEGSGARGDVVFNNGSAILHQQVLYGLSLKAGPKKIKAGQKTQVTFKVTDAGAAVISGVPRAGGSIQATGLMDAATAAGRACALRSRECRF